MKLALFGATGRTGLRLLMQALDSGHKVTALVRDQSKLPLRHENLRVLEGDARDFGAVERTIAGSDAVLSTLGHRGILRNTAISEAVSHMITIMERSKVNRIVTMASVGMLGEFGAIGAILNVVLASSQSDHRRQIRLLEKSALDWTVVRCVFLTNGPRTGTYRVEKKGVPRRGLFISREDVAQFMLKCVTGKRYVRGSPAVAR